MSEQNVGKNVEEVKKLHSLLFGNLKNLNHTFRFSGSAKNKEQSVSEHSFGTAIISISLIKYENEKRKERGIPISILDLSEVVIASLLHDSEEVITGDIQHLFKWHEEARDFREKLDVLTKEVVKKELFSKLLSGEFFLESWLKSHEDEKINYLIKMSDWLQLLQYSNEEVFLGNKNFEPIVRRVVNLINVRNNSEKQKEQFIFIPTLINDYLKTEFYSLLD